MTEACVFLFVQRLNSAPWLPRNFVLKLVKELQVNVINRPRDDTKSHPLQLIPGLEGVRVHRCLYTLDHAHVVVGREIGVHRPSHF